MFIIPTAKKLVIGAVAVGALSFGTAGMAGAATVPGPKGHHQPLQLRQRHTKVLTRIDNGEARIAAGLPKLTAAQAKASKGGSLEELADSSVQADHHGWRARRFHTRLDQGLGSHRGQVQRDRLPRARRRRQAPPPRRHDLADRLDGPMARRAGQGPCSWTSSGLAAGRSGGAMYPRPPRSLSFAHRRADTSDESGPGSVHHESEGGSAMSSISFTGKGLIFAGSSVHPQGADCGGPVRGALSVAALGSRRSEAGAATTSTTSGGQSPPRGSCTNARQRAPGPRRQAGEAASSAGSTGSRPWRRRPRPPAIRSVLPIWSGSSATTRPSSPVRAVGWAPTRAGWPKRPPPGASRSPSPSVFGRRPTVQARNVPVEGGRRSGPSSHVSDRRTSLIVVRRPSPGAPQPGQRAGRSSTREWARLAKPPASVGDADHAAAAASSA